LWRCKRFGFIDGVKLVELVELGKRIVIPFVIKVEIRQILNIAASIENFIAPVLQVKAS